MVDLDADGFLTWLDEYERLWRTSGVAGLSDLFAEQASYLQSPVEQPHVGIDAIAAMWEAQRDGADEVFTMTREVVAITGDTGVARVLVRYGEPVRQEYIDLWVVRFDSSGKAVHFEEWPYWPGKTFAAGRAKPVVVDAASVQTDGYAEWVRSGSLSAGVYRLAAGAADGQSPHDEDEVYVVTRGTGALEIEGSATPVGPGSVAYVPARAQHRFVDISDDLELVVVFAPPESESSG
jgi:mannose-6-phosphate isomerase-like protein (cupin superfamily)